MCTYTDDNNNERVMYIIISPFIVVQCAIEAI